MVAFRNKSALLLFSPFRNKSAISPATVKGTQACSVPRGGERETFTFRPWPKALSALHFSAVQPKSEGHSVLSQLFD
jgi:hypothetical protein